MLKRLFLVNKFQGSGPFYVPGTLCLSDTSYLDNLYRHQREASIINVFRVLLVYFFLSLLTSIFFSMSETYVSEVVILWLAVSVIFGFAIDGMLARREKLTNLSESITVTDANRLAQNMEPYKNDPLVRDTVAEILKFNRLPCRKEEIEIRKYLAELDDQNDLGVQKKNVMDAFARLATG